MVKTVSLDEIAVGYDDISKERKRFLELCARRVYEAIRIWVEAHPEFDYRLAGGKVPYEVMIYSSRDYDAEIRAGRWCYIQFISTNDKTNSRTHVDLADRTGFVFSYKNQKFKVHYDEIPRRHKS